MITNEKTNKQLRAERDFLNALIDCLNGGSTPQVATLPQAPSRNSDHRDEGAAATPAKKQGTDN